MRSPVRLVRNIEAGRLFDTFLVTSIVTVLTTRLYLHLTGYPQVGGSSLHIAHLLPGGLLMLAAIFVMLGAINRSARDLAAIVGGVGFGLFWDELGKFITKDNNYFFRPTAGLIYVSFVALYLITRYIASRNYHADDYLANAVDLIMEGTVGELDPQEYARAEALLKLADPHHPMFAATQQLLISAKPTKAYQPFFYNKIIRVARKPFLYLLEQVWFARALLGIFYLYGLGLVLTLIFVLAHGTKDPFLDLVANPAGESNNIAAISSVISAIYIVWGAWLIQKQHIKKALQRFETAILINIFVTQVFLFFSYQFTAVVTLAATLVLLIMVRILLAETKS